MDPHFAIFEVRRGMKNLVLQKGSPGARHGKLHVPKASEKARKARSNSSTDLRRAGSTSSNTITFPSPSKLFISSPSS
jgi:hypothetical protein